MVKKTQLVRLTQRAAASMEIVVPDQMDWGSVAVARPRLFRVCPLDVFVAQPC